MNKNHKRYIIEGSDSTEQDVDAKPEQEDEETIKKKKELEKLIHDKDVIVLQYNGGMMSSGEYRQKIGNIPQQIKKLRDQISSSSVPTSPQPDKEGQEAV